MKPYISVLKRTICLLFSLIFAFSLPLSAYAEDDSELTEIKVGVINFDQTSYSQQYNYYTEYFEALNHLLIKEGYRLKLVLEAPQTIISMGNNNEFTAIISSDHLILENGHTLDIDRALDLRANASAYVALNCRIVLFGSSMDKTVYFGDKTCLSGKKIGYLADATIDRAIKDYVTGQYSECTFVKFTDSDLMHDSLESGELSAVVAEYGAAGYDKVLAFLAEVPMRLTAMDGDTPAYKALLKAESFLFQENTQFLAELFEKHLSDDNYLAFTRKESELIEAREPISVVCSRDYKPNEYYDVETEEYRGSNINYIKKIAEVSGLNIRFIETPSDSQNIMYINEGKADVLLHAYDFDGVDGMVNAELSKPYTLTELVAIGKFGSDFSENSNMRIAVNINRYFLFRLLMSSYQNFSIRFFADDKSCLDAVKNGDADAIVSDSSSFSSLLSINPYSDIGILSTLDDEVGVCFAVSKTEKNDLLIGILNKTIAQINKVDFRSIQIENTELLVHDQTIGEFLQKNIFVVISLFLFIAIVFVIILSKTMINARIAENRSAFIAKMSHEIRTPLNGIIGMSLLIRERIDDKENTRSCLSRIDASSKHLLSLVNGILDCAKIEKDKITIREESFYLIDDIEYLSNEYKATAARSGVHFTTIIRNLDVGYVIGDSMHFRQIIINLLSNAIKFTPKGKSVYFEVSKLREEEGRSIIAVNVGDEGIGIDEKDLKRIFKSFDQGSIENKGTYSGAGLGLYIARSLLYKMGGDITVESTVNVGSTFRVTIPFKNDTEKKIGTKRYHLYPHICSVGLDARQQAFINYLCNEKRINYISFSGFDGLMTNVADLNEKYVLVIEKSFITGRGVIQAIRKLYPNSKIFTALSDNLDTDISPDCVVDGVVSLPIFPGDFSRLINAFRPKRRDGSIQGFELLDMRILIVEDNELNKEIAAELLTMCGATCESAENGKIAVDMYESKPAGYYDLILMDIRMPVMDGIEATKTIRASQKEDHEGIAIIAMSANAFDSDIKQSKDAGMNAHLIKPIEMKTVIKTIREIVRGDEDE